jgi:hypothetical protein
MPFNPRSLSFQPPTALVLSFGLEFHSGHVYRFRYYKKQVVMSAKVYVGSVCAFVLIHPGASPVHWPWGSGTNSSSEVI